MAIIFPFLFFFILKCIFPFCFHASDAYTFADFSISIFSRPIVLPPFFHLKDIRSGVAKKPSWYRSIERR